MQGINLTISQSSSVCVVGHDGAGKTTLLKILKGLIKPTSGSVTFFFPDVITFKNIGYLGGDPYDSFVGCTVEEEIVFGPENLGLNRDEIRKRLDYALEVTDLVGLENRLTHTLSGGEQQRLALASVLVMDLKILVLDDALSMMDPPSRRRHWSWINKLKSDLNLSVIFTTNSLSELRSADRVLFLDGESRNFIFDGSSDDFIRDNLAEEWINVENGIDKFARCISCAGRTLSDFWLQ